ncbi:MAG: hypothetical protein QM238_09155, partial [Bacteroidota bacterium]|nr:hypothetical protein [Bacteroidota bacterium]
CRNSDSRHLPPQTCLTGSAKSSPASFPALCEGISFNDFLLTGSPEKLHCSICKGMLFND